MDKERIKSNWCNALESSIKFDLWGQVVEAVEGYNDLVNKIVQAVPELGLKQKDKVSLEILVYF